MTHELVLEILDADYNRVYITPNVISAQVTEELGLVGDGNVTIPLSDPAVQYVPDPNSTKVYDARWKLYENDPILGLNNLVFSGVVDDTARNIGGDYTFTFGGKQRGILIGERNMGLRQFNGWPLEMVYNEFLRDNIGRSPFATVVSCSSVEPPDESGGIAPNPPVTVIDGAPSNPNMWEAAATGANFITIDLGEQKPIVGVRVMPPWWDQKWYTFTVHTSTDNSSFTLRGTQSARWPATERGTLYEFNTTCRYVKVTVTNSTDAIARLAQVLVYEQLGAVGADTDFVVPWVENDDSGNTSHSTTGVVRVVEQGSWNGDGISGHSFVTRLTTSGSYLTHNFRGTGDAAYITQGDSGGTASMVFSVDGGAPSAPVIVDAGTFQVKAFEVLDLTPGDHTLRVIAISGTPQVDYFSGLLESAYRQVEDDDGSIGYFGTWEEIENTKFRRQFAHQSGVTGSLVYYEFTGDYIAIIGALGPTLGKMEVYIDGVLDATIDEWEDHYSWQRPVYAWSGTYGNHLITVRVTGTHRAESTGSNIIIDGFQGNFSHIVYMSSSYDNNIRMLTDLSEMVASWLRYNNDGSVDLLGSVGTTSNTIIREGENDGGTIIEANTTNDYSQACSAILAVVSNTDGLPPTTVFLIDKNAEQKMGIKVRFAQHANSPDPFTLVRQAWSELQEFKKPVRQFSVTYDPDDVGPIDVGETTILYSNRLNLAGDEAIRVGKLTTEWSTSA